MKYISKEWLAFLRQQYPIGSRIRLRERGATDPQPIKPGSMGTLQRIDSIGTFHVKWDDGRSVELAVGQDSFTVQPPEPTMLKLYMPLTISLYEKNEWGDWENDCEIMDDRSAHAYLRAYEDKIIEALIEARTPEEKQRGIMHWYNANDSVNEKVRSVVFTAERRDNRRWGVAECQVVGTLTPEEMETLTGYIGGQASDGWGEVFEQREIRVDDGKLYVHLWNSDNWSIMTEKDRFDPAFSHRLPDLCWSVKETDGSLIYIKKGEDGSFPSEWDVGNAEKNRHIADYNNKKRGITWAQRQAMEFGSMYGWDCPGADPGSYERAQEQGMQML